MDTEIREQVKRLWKICFGDKDDFVDLYFDMRYNEEVNNYISQDGKVVSALQMLPYSFSFYQDEMKAAYISGACTHPDYRNQGIMYQLLSDSFKKMQTHKVDMSMLIPAEEWLYGYYEKAGYASVFESSIQSISPQALTDNKDIHIEHVNDFRDDIYLYFNNGMHKRNFCIQHSVDDIKVVMADMKIDNGTVLAATNNNGICGVVFLYREKDTIYIVELLSDNDFIAQKLLQSVKAEHQNNDIKMITPYIDEDTADVTGMIRIIDAFRFVRVYANNHPSLKMNILLKDPILSENNGYYQIANGDCEFSKDCPTREYQEMTIGELSKFIFKGEHPFMSLMMD
jgi:predicted acetyltransferase